MDMKEYYEGFVKIFIKSEEHLNTFLKDMQTEKAKFTDSQIKEIRQLWNFDKKVIVKDPFFSRTKKTPKGK